MQEPARTPDLCAGPGVRKGCWDVLMLQMFDVAKRIFILVVFLIASAWLIWRGNSYTDPGFSIIPAVMCALESLLLVFVGVSLMRRPTDSEE